MKNIDPKKMPYPENLLTAVGLKKIFGTDEYPGLDEDQMRGLQHVLNMLTEREREVLRYRYEECETYRRIGDRYGRSVERIRQIQQKALRKLTHPSRMIYVRDGYQRTENRKQEEERQRQKKFDELWRERLSEWEKVALADIGLSVRAYSCLIRADMKTQADLMRAMLEHPEDVRRLRNMGIRTYKEIEDKLTELTDGLWKQPVK